MTHAARALRSHELSGDGINFVSHTFLTKQGHGDPPRMRDHLNTWATSETTWTWKTVHTPVHANEVNMKGWLWRPIDIPGPYGPKASWHLSYRWGKTPKNAHPGNLSRPGIESGSAMWHARVQPPAPQRRTELVLYEIMWNIYIAFCLLNSNS